MKAKNILLAAVLFLSLGIFAQAPEKINYQAVARDLNGLALTGETVNLQFDIIQSSTTVYSETQTLTTNQFGLFTAQIGGGTVVSGNFSTIAWGSSPTSLQVTVNGDVMPSTQLLSVPYALYSKESANGPTGATGPAGIGINWLGTLATVPGTANLNDAYYNSTDGIAYIYDGTTWQIIAQDGSASGDNWGTQVVQTSGTNISGDGTGGSPLTVTEGDPSPTNELQDLTVTGNNLNISGGAGTTIAATAPNTGDYLYWNGINWVPQSIVGNTDNQNLLNGGKTGNTQTINIQNGTGTSFSVADGDSSITNEIQTISASGGTSPQIDLSNTGGDVKFLGTGGTTLNQVGNAITINTATSSDNQDLINGGKTGNNQTLNIQNGTGTTFSVADGDTSSTNEIELPATAGVGDVLTFNAGSWVAQPIPAAPATFWTQGSGILYPTTLTDNIGIGINTPAYDLDVFGPTTNAMINIESNGTPINTMAGLRFAIGTQSVTGTQYYAYAEKTNSTANATQSDFIMRKDFSTAGGYLKFFRFDNSSNDIIINDSKTSAGAFGNLIVNNGDVGIGTNNPTEKLQIHNGNIGVFRDDSNDANITLNGDNNGIVWTLGNEDSDGAFFKIASSGSLATSTRLTIADNGEVGIGIVNNMSGKLHVSSSVASWSTYNNAVYGEATGSIQSSRGIAGVSWGTGLYGIGTYGNASGAATNNYGVYGIATGGTNNFAGYFDDGNVYIENNLGIGTTSPNFPLEVRGGASQRGAYIETNGMNSASSKIGVTGIANNGAGAGINKGGSFNAIGGTGGDNYGVDAQAVNGSANQRAVSALTSGGTGTNYAIYASATGGATNWAGYFSGNVYMSSFLGVNTLLPISDITVTQTSTAADGTNGIRVESGGDGWNMYHSGVHLSFANGGVRQAYITGGTGVYVVTSDINKKQNISLLDNVIPNLMKLKPSRYQYMSSGDDSPYTYGIMVQDVQKTFPDLVHTAENGDLGLGYDEFVPLAIKAIQEQQKMIEELKKEVEALKNKQ